MKTTLLLFFQISLLSVSGAQSLTMKSFPTNAFPQRPLAAAYLSFRNDQVLGVDLASPLLNTRPSSTPYAFNPAALPFFCKIEFDMMKGKKLPFKFRLGDVEYVDELENKRPSYNSK